MKFERVPVELARGHILGHNVFHEGEQILRKGVRLHAAEIERLRATNLESVYVARLERGDVPENAAADRIASALIGPSDGRSRQLAYRGAATGRVTIRSRVKGVLHIDTGALLGLNRIPGVTLAVRAPFAVVNENRPIATLKIIPFAVGEPDVAEAEAMAQSGVIHVSELVPRRVAILAVGAPGRESSVLGPFIEPLKSRLARLGTRAVEHAYIPIEADPETTLAHAITRYAVAGCELLIVVGDTATMDEDDLAPAAVRRAGGRVGVVGAPVFPGNLLFIGYHERCAIMGAPGCARYPAPNVVDLVLPRLLSGERLARDDIAALGVGGLIAAADTDSEMGP